MRRFHTTFNGAHGTISYQRLPCAMIEKEIFWPSKRRWLPGGRSTFNNYWTGKMEMRREIGWTLMMTIKLWTHRSLERLKDYQRTCNAAGRTRSRSYYSSTEVRSFNNRSTEYFRRNGRTKKCLPVSWKASHAQNKIKGSIISQKKPFQTTELWKHRLGFGW